MIKGSKEFYKQKVFDKLKSDLSLKSVSQVPRLEKIVLSMGLGEAKNNKGIIKEGVEVIELLAGQKAVVTLSKKAIAGFKIREEMPIGCKVTLRSEKMYSFLTKLVNVSLPRERDFHGISRRGFDSRGNYTLGLVDFKIFPEVAHLHTSSIGGLSVVFVTTTSSDREAELLLEKLGLPFQEKREKIDQ